VAEPGGRTGAGLLLGELVDEHGDPERVRGLGGDEEVVVVVDDEADEDERGHPRDDGEEGLDLGRLATHPGHHHGNRPPRRTPHLPPACRTVEAQAPASSVWVRMGAPSAPARAWREDLSWGAWDRRGGGAGGVMDGLGWVGSGRVVAAVSIRGNDGHGLRMWSYDNGKGYQVFPTIKLSLFFKL
jgi:hypothetical protein